MTINSQRTAANFVEVFNRNTVGMKHLSTGFCPSCPECRDSYDLTNEEADTAKESGFYGEGYFIWAGCDLCGNLLGGLKTSAHYHDEKNNPIHLDNVCEDCILYIANGDLPTGE